MLNLLRDHARLERRGARLLHSKDVEGLQDLTRELGGGAIIYVDDFSGTGKQFIRNRMHAASFVIGTFAEFFLLACICEEAIMMLDEVGVVPIYGRKHMRANDLYTRAHELSPLPRRRLSSNYARTLIRNRHSALGN